MDALNGGVLLETDEGVWLRQDPGLAAGARRAAAAVADRLGMGAGRKAELELAVTEVATNLARHADDGAMLLRTVSCGSRTGLELLAVDSGPGMVDLAASMADGVTSRGTLGIGLGAVARMADSLDIHSVRGRGTVLNARFWPVRTAGGDGARPGSPESVVAGLTRPLSGETACGDGWAARLDPGDPRTPAGARPAILVMLCDGLGHGPLAAMAAQKAVAAFRGSRLGEPAALLGLLHGALAGTRGAAAAVARIEPQAGRVVFSGVGNVSAFVVDGDGRSALLSAPGIVGHQMPRTRTFEQRLSQGAALVMHSDGLTERWDHLAAPGLLAHGPAVIAGYLLREAGVRRDDASILVARAPR